MISAFKAIASDRADLIKSIARRGLVAVAAAAIVAVSYGDAEARRGGRVLKGIGIGVGTAIILNEVLKAGEPERRRARAAPTTSNPRVGLDAERIRALQTALVAHGYDAGTPDGVWGNRARTATIQFQQDLGQPETGTLTGEQIVLLRDATAGRIPQRVTARLDQAAAIADEGGLRSDSSREDIRDMQSVLTQMGFYNGPTDGSWGRGVEAAVTRFQQHERSMPLGRLTLDQSERILGRTLAHAAAPASPADTGSYQGRASDTQPPVRVMSVRPVDQARAARDDAAGLRFQDLPPEVRDHVSAIRHRCKEETGGNVPSNEMQGIQQVNLDGGPAIIAEGLRLCNDHIPTANCTNRACDLTIWAFEHSGAWRQVFSDHVYGPARFDVDPEANQFRSMSVGIYAGDSRCEPPPGKEYNTGRSCSVGASYSNGRWNYVVEHRPEE